MAKHIIVQSIYQLTIMIVAIFLGHYFLPEEFDRDTHGAYAEKVVVAGQTTWVSKEGYNKEPRALFLGIYTIRSGLNMYDEYDDPLAVDSRHFTYCFNLFVIMQIFNFINARKIDDSLNTLSNISHSPIFIGVVILIFVLQFLIVSFGSVAFKVTIFVKIYCG